MGSGFSFSLISLDLLTDTMIAIAHYLLDFKPASDRYFLVE